MITTTIMKFRLPKRRVPERPHVRARRQHARGRRDALRHASDERRLLVPYEQGAGAQGQPWQAAFFRCLPHDRRRPRDGLDQLAQSARPLRCAAAHLHLAAAPLHRSFVLRLSFLLVNKY